MIFLSLLFQVLSMVLSKVAALQMHTMSFREVVHNGPFFGSLLCLGLQAVAWPQALRRFPLAWAYLFMSGIFLAIPLASVFWFHETVTAGQYLGSLVIMAGMAVLLSGGEAKANG